MNVCILASGSSGNSTVIWNEKSGILIDCGRSGKFITESLASIGLPVSHIKALIVTHGHGDHIGAGAITLSRTHHIPIYIHRNTFKIVSRRDDCKGIVPLSWSLIKHHGLDPFEIGDFTLQPFSTYHTGGFAGEPFGFAIRTRRGKKTVKLGFVTDTGKVDDAIIESLIDSHALIIEANHDPRLVQISPRHPLNKQWVLSDSGHLSNEESARTIAQIVRNSKKGTLKTVFLAHISEQHNTPEHALEQVSRCLPEHCLSSLTLLPTYHRRRTEVFKVA